MRRWSKRLIACAALLFAAGPAWGLSPFFVFFERGSARLNRAAELILDSAVAFIRTADVREIEISGFTDRVGSESANIALSRRRAEAVRDALLAKGMSRHVTVRIIASGEQGLLTPTEDNVPEPQNRLAMIILFRLCTNVDYSRVQRPECQTPLPD